METLHKDSGGVARAISRKLKALGYITGSYGKQSGGQRIGEVEGYMVHRIGCSDTITIHWTASGQFTNPSATTRCKEMAAKVQQEVRNMGYSVDERGWIDCSLMPL